MITVCMLASLATRNAVSQGIGGTSNCVGYLISGAGSPEVDGCYQQQGTYGMSPRFVLDGGHELYAWQGVWRLGLSGKNVTYTSMATSVAPPESAGGCGDVWLRAPPPVGGQDPCPAVRRVGLPPTPAPAPTPPPSPAPTPPPAPEMRLVWAEEFDSPTLNESRWNVLEQVHRGGVYVRGNVRVENGWLVLRTVAQNLTIAQGGKPTPFYVTSGAVNTSGLFEQRTGRWEARVRLPRVGLSPGYTLHPSIWLFANMRDPARSGCPQEIDVVEQYAAPAPGRAQRSSAVANLHPFGKRNATSTRSMHTRGGGGSGGCVPQPYGPHASTAATGDRSSGWNTFTVDWTDEWIAMYVNGELYANFGGNPSAVAAFTDPLFLALTSCVMTRAPPTAVDVFPLEYFIDSVRVYEWI
eukprot:g6970.t1